MEYTKELAAFTDWLEANPLDATTQALWLHLMAIRHKSGSPEWFQVANLTLQAKLGVTDKTLSKHRNYLVQKGRIQYESQGKQKAGKYLIVPLAEQLNGNIPVNHSVSYPSNYPVNHPLKGSALFDRQKDTSTDTHSADAHVENPWQTMRREFALIFGHEMIKSHYDIVNGYLDDGMELEVIVLALYACKPHKPDYEEYLWRTIGSWFTKGVLTVTNYRRRQEELAAELANQPRQKRGSKVVQLPYETDHDKAGKERYGKLFGAK